MNPVTTAALVLGLMPAFAYAASCESLKSLALPDVTIDSSTTVPAGPFKDPNLPWAPAVQVPEYCGVKGTIRPTSDSDIKFEVWLPVAGWNGKLQGAGNGGFAGSIGYRGGLVEAVQRGYAGVSTDTGHTGGSEDIAWAKDHPGKLVDYGHRGIHLMTVNAKAIVKAYYGEAPKRAYFASCSNGGRQALMTAQRYPEDYDGIIAGAPANDWTGLILGFTWNAQAQLASADSYIPAAKAAVIQAEVISQCDKLDGVADGVIGMPPACNFDPGKLLCKDAQTDACFTAPQVVTLRKIYHGPQTSKGAQLFSGFTPGAEVGALPGLGWDGWILGQPAGNSTQARFAKNFMRSVATGDDKWEYGGFDFDRDAEGIVAKFGATLNATDPDLSRFTKRGGKLILFHGWADAAVPPANTVKYYQDVVAKLGAEKSAGAVRLFMVPGMQHCFAGPGPATFGGMTAALSPGDPSADLSAALERWVEQGVAPETIRAVKPKNLLAGLYDPTQGGVERSGLLCAYPKHAKWNGAGSADDAASYACIADATVAQH
jgi:feruloyl esterase